MKFKKLFFKNYSKIIVFVLGIFGIAPGCMKAEYGTPYAEFKLNGNVKSALTEEPIKNIKVSIDNYQTVSDENGNFSFSTTDFPKEITYSLNFSDIDSSLNGNYNDLDTNITFDQANFVGGDGKWNKGVNEKNITIELKEK